MHRPYSIPVPWMISREAIPAGFKMLPDIWDKTTIISAGYLDSRAPPSGHTAGDCPIKTGFSSLGPVRQ
jgi:hypothetical protein